MVPRRSFLAALAGFLPFGAADAQTIVTGTNSNPPGTVALLPSYLVASLPSGTIGQLAYVTNGTSGLAWGATVAGTQTTKYLCWYNGANWTVVGE